MPGFFTSHAGRHTIDLEKHVESYRHSGYEVVDEDVAGQEHYKIGVRAVTGRINCPQKKNVQDKLNNKDDCLCVEDNVDIFSGRGIGYGALGTDVDCSHFDEGHDNMKYGEEPEINVLVFTLVVFGVEAKQTESAQIYRACNLIKGTHAECLHE